jgi:hypothetical protein
MVSLHPVLLTPGELVRELSEIPPICPTPS